jgi:hypothetical protein
MKPNTDSHNIVIEDGDARENANAESKNNPNIQNAIACQPEKQNHAA